MATITIRYCTQCRWMLRAAWMLQELLLTFQDEISQAILVPATGGVFEVYANDALVWSRKAQGSFPELKELKQRIRNQIAPNKNLGHSDTA